MVSSKEHDSKEYIDEKRGGQTTLLRMIERGKKYYKRENGKFVTRKRGSVSKTVPRAG